MSFKKSTALQGDTSHAFILRIKDLYDTGIRDEVTQGRIRRATQTLGFIASLNYKNHKCLALPKLRKILAGIYIPTEEEIKTLAYDFALNKSDDPNAFAAFVQLGKEYRAHCQARPSIVAPAKIETPPGNSEAPVAKIQNNDGLSFEQKLIALRDPLWITGLNITNERISSASKSLSRLRLSLAISRDIKTITALEKGECFTSRMVVKHWKKSLDDMLSAMHASVEQRDDILDAFDKRVAQVEAERQESSSNGEEKTAFADKVSRGDIELS